MIVSYHLAKREVSMPEQTQEAIRGSVGLVDRVRHNEPLEPFHAIGQRPRSDWVGTLRDHEEPVMPMARGSKLVKCLDVPGSPVASGQAVFVTGHLGRSGAERPDGN